VFLGASPERLIRLDGRNVQASSLAGTARRGADEAEDAEIVAELFASAKDRVEHAVVVRALKEVLGEFCDDVTASSEPSLLTLPNVHHLETEVSGHLRPGNTLFKVIARLHPTPAVGGSPRDEALRFIRSVEEIDRGWYAGPIGWIGREGGEFAVALRSAILYGPEAMLYAGCGIVAESDPNLEFTESVLKLQPMKSAIAAALTESASASVNVPAADHA
jgi:menaquinone-specific isochorismate synthase